MMIRQRAHEQVDSTSHRRAVVSRGVLVRRLRVYVSHTPRSLLLRVKQGLRV